MIGKRLMTSIQMTTVPALLSMALMAIPIQTIPAMPRNSQMEPIPVMMTRMMTI